MEPLGPSSGFREHVVVTRDEVTDAVVELAGAWARHRWGSSARVVRVEREARTIVVWAPDSANVAATLVSAIEVGAPPGLRPGTRRKAHRRF